MTLQAAAKNILKYSIFALLAVGLLYLAFSSVDLTGFWDQLAHADYFWVGISVLIGYAAIVSRGYRWRLLLEPLGYQPRFWNSVNAVSVLYFVNLALPRAGEVARCTSLYQVEKIPVNKLIGTVLLERAVDFVMLMIVTGIAVILNFQHFEDLLELTLTTDAVPGDEGGISLGTLLLIGFVLFLILIFIFRMRIVAHPYFEKIRTFYIGIKEGFKAVFKMKRQASFWLNTVFIWASYFMMTYLCFNALPQTTDFTVADGFFVMMAASLGIVVPTPGGIGAYHYLVMMALVVLGLSNADGLLFATLLHTAQSLMMVATGAFATLFLYLERRRIKKANLTPDGQD